MWKHFGFKDGNQSKVLCKVCKTSSPRNKTMIEGIKSELATYKAEANVSMDERPLVW